MKLSEMTVKNFGNYGEVSFPMEHTMFILEKNGYGKSTFLKALNYGLSGNYEPGTTKEGCDDMMVRLVFEDGLVVERRRSGTKLTSKMGVGKAKMSSKEAVNTAIARYCGNGIGMDSIQVIASSRELFEMRPEALAEFFMQHIPNRMNITQLLGYIDSVTPEMEAKIRETFNGMADFGQDDINAAYKQYDSVRKDDARELKVREAKVAGYDFSIPVRDPEIVQEELNAVMKEIGAALEKKKARENYEQLKAKRKAQLDTARKLKDDYNAIKAAQPDENQLSLLNGKEKDFREYIRATEGLINKNQASIENLESVIASLRKGTCPQVAGMRCPNDWTEMIAGFEQNRDSMKITVKKLQENLATAESSLSGVLKSRDAFMRNQSAYAEKLAKLQQYQAVKDALVELPEEPEEVKEDLTPKKMRLEAELRESHNRKEMQKIRDSIEPLRKEKDLYEVLSKCFSPKGCVLNGNLSYYLDFLEGQINVQADRLGYKLALSMDGGLHISIGRSGDEDLIDIQKCSGGERSIAIFLLLSILNQITGVRILLLDEVETLDNEVWKKLLALIKDTKDDYDHVIFAGVNHTDTIEALKEVFDD